MGEIKLFQICYEGELTIGVTNAMRRLGAEPNFDQSWQVWLPDGRHSAPLVRYIRTQIDSDARLVVGCTHFSKGRDFLLIRHSLTNGNDYTELHDAIQRLGVVIELPFDSTFVVQSSDRTDVHTLGLALGELCPDESLMVTGISHDWAYCDGRESRMNVGSALEAGAHFRTF